MASCLIDSSAFIRFFAEDDPHSHAVIRAVQDILASGALICFTPQVARESWTVLTRPKEVGGYGLDPNAAATFIERAHEGFSFAPDTPEVYEIWRGLVEDLQVLGKQTHDAYHAAAMMAHGMETVLTLDERDFKRYPAIYVLHPTDL